MPGLSGGGQAHRVAALTGLSPWAFIAGLAVVAVAVLMLVRKRDISPEP